MLKAARLKAASEVGGSEVRGSEVGGSEIEGSEGNRRSININKNCKQTMNYFKF